MTNKTTQKCSCYKTVQSEARYSSKESIHQCNIVSTLLPWTWKFILRQGSYALYPMPHFQKAFPYRSWIDWGAG